MMKAKSLVRFFEQQARLKPRPLILADPCQFKFSRFGHASEHNGNFDPLANFESQQQQNSSAESRLHFASSRQAAVESSSLPAFQQRVVKPHLVAVINHFEAAFGQTAQHIG